MQIRVLFDSESVTNDLHTGWGISLLLDDKILFDTGEKGAWLIHNAKRMGVDFSQLEAIVISHDHFDHTGGLWDVLEKKKGVKVYACPNFGLTFKKKVSDLGGRLFHANKFREISEGILTTGEILGEYKGQAMPEQSLVLKTDSGISVVTGCAHPGIIKIMREVRDHFPSESIYLVMGGFHLTDEDEIVIELIVDELKRMGVKKVGPTHCTGYEAKGMFKKTFGEDCVSVEVGGEIHV